MPSGLVEGKMNRRSVVQVADYSAAFSSNFVAALLELGRRLQENLELDSVFVFPSQTAERPWTKDLAETGVPVRFVDKEAPHRDRVRTLARIARESRAVLLHSHFGTFDVDTSLAAHRVGCGSVWHMHSPYPVHATLRKRLGEQTKFALLSHLMVDRIVAVSPTVAESAVAHGGARRKVTVVLNGIDVSRFKPPNPDRRAALRRQFGVPKDWTAFLVFGWAPRRKGVDLVVKASETLRTAGHRGFVTLVLGAEDGPSELRELVRDAREIRIVPPIPDITDLYGTADCLVSASRSEGLPYAVGEAMAAQRVVVSSDLPQVVAAYGPAGAGVLTFRTGDAQGLAEAMARVLETPLDERSRLGAANASFVASHLSLGKWSRQVLAIYRTVLETRGQSPPSTHFL